MPRSLEIRIRLQLLRGTRHGLLEPFRFAAGARGKKPLALAISGDRCAAPVICLAFLPRHFRDQESRVIWEESGCGRDFPSLRVLPGGEFAESVTFARSIPI